MSPNGNNFSRLCKAGARAANFLALFFLAASTAAASPVRFYLGTFTSNSPSQGIYTGTLDPRTGKLGALELAAAVPDPGFLALSRDGQTLYSVSSTNGGSTLAFHCEKDGKLRPLDSRPSGQGGTYVAVSGNGKNVVVANYAGGNVVAFLARPDGSLGGQTASVLFTGSGPIPGRQEKPHPHSANFDSHGRQVYVCDLGTDWLSVFDLDARYGTLRAKPSPSVKLPPGSGPRHLAFSRLEKFVFVNGELGMNVTTFARAAHSGALSAPETVPIFPPGTDTAGMTSAEIACHPSGQWLYVSNRDVAGRGRDSIVCFSFGADGRLARQQVFPVPVKIPRGFAIDPGGRWLIVGGQKDNRIAVLKIDANDGKLSETGETAAVGAPVCVAFKP